MLATLCVPALAADYTATGDQGATVTYAVAPTYTVTIPEAVTVAGETETISATDVVVKKNEYVSISLDAENDFTVATAEGAELTYTVKANGQTVAAGGELLAVYPGENDDGSVQIAFELAQTIEYAGVYTGTVTFVIAVKEIP